MIVSWGSTFAQNEFISTWKTDNAGVSNSSSFTIPTFGTGYNYDVDWDNDGTFDEFGLTGNVTHDFGVAGTYTIRIQGSFPRIYFDVLDDKLKILDISQWGNIEWSSMELAFDGCMFLNFSATDAPDLSDVTSCDYMLQHCLAFNANIDSWDVSNITSMRSMFWGCSAFNQPLNSWDVSSVTNFQSTFSHCTIFNQPLADWDVSSATTMKYMFNHTIIFNQDISAWNTGQLTILAHAFNDAFSFDQNLGSWDVSNVTDAAYMFDDVELNLR